MILQETYTLSNGVDIPRIGLGTWFVKNRNVAQLVRDAINVGYRHVDTAQAYRNESGVGEGIRTASVARHELFVTTKVDAGIKSYDKAAQSIDESVRRMGLDYLDMMIIHSPQPWRQFHGDNGFLNENREVWRALEDAYAAGKLRAIGLSNFEQRDIDNIVNHCVVKPMVNQILAHIGNTPADLIEYSQQQGMLVEAYSPIAHGELMKNQRIIAVATNYGVSPAQLSIRFLLQLGLLPLPKTTSPAYLFENAEVDFEISAPDMEILRSIPPIEDYGNASMLPVYGGKMNLKSILSMAVQAVRG